MDHSTPEGYKWYDTPRLNLHSGSTPTGTDPALNSDSSHGEMSSAVVEHMNNFFAHHHGGLSGSDSQGHRAAAARYYHQSMHTPYAASHVSIVQPEIYNETPEQKIIRLERTLAFEREEKWATISQSERRRVQLINFKKGLLVKENEFYGEDDEERENRFVTEESTENADEPDEDLKSFQIRMQQFREARLKAVSDKSKELNDLRDEVIMEKELRKIAEMKLATTVLSAHTVHDDKISMHLMEHNIILHKRIEKLRNDIEAENLSRKYDKNLRNEIYHLKKEICTLKRTDKQQIEMENLKKVNERLVRDLEFSKKEKQRLENKLNDVDEEQKRAWADYDQEKVEIARRTVALKEVIEVSRQMLAIRDQQVADLKSKINDIEKSIEEKNRLEEGPLKVEYEKQLENIKVLKELYAERMELMESEKNNLTEQRSEDAKKIENLNNELSDLSMKYDLAADEVDCERQKNVELAAEGCALAAQARGCQRELTAMNQMLTRMLLGRSPAELDRLGELLQQNHGLIARIATSEPYNDVAASLPKLLLDLIAQVDEKESTGQSIEVDKFDLTDQMTDSTDTLSGHSEGLAIVSYKNAVIFRSNQNKIGVADETASQPLPPHHYQPPTDMDPIVQEIVNNLPKVWKVLTELLSQQTPIENPASNEDRTCYKCIDTPQGPKNVISVSKTFLKLKDLILEKKSLTHEVGRLKHLNTHLETRLDEQEKRLSTVQCELHKTWGVVGKMRAQHQQLHNQEKILRYELQEKRLMLGELKEELEICRDKWQKARQKNLISEAECAKLRQEFAARRLLRNARDSGESGYSDGTNSSDTDRSSTSSPMLFTTEKNINADKSKETSNIANDDKSKTDEKLSGKLPENTMDPEQAQTSRLKPDKVETANEEAEKTAEGNRSRQARLSRLEEQCQLLVRKVEITTHKSHFLSNRLEELHDHYSGPSEGSGGTSGTQKKEGKSDTTEKTEVETAVENTEAKEGLNSVILKEDNTPEANNTNEKQDRVTPEVENTVETKESKENEEGATCLNFFEIVQCAEDRINENIVTETQLEKTEKINENSTSYESRMEARAARLKRLEEESLKLLNKTRNTIQRSDHLSERLEELHNEYSRPEDTNGLVQVPEETMSENLSLLAESEQKPNNVLLNEDALSEFLQVSPENADKNVTDNEVSIVNQNEPRNNQEGCSAQSGEDRLSGLEEESSFLKENCSSYERRMEARAARLKRLEEESMKVLSKTRNTIQRSDNLSERLEELHHEYSRPDNTNGLAVVPEDIHPESMLSESDQKSNNLVQNEECASESLQENVDKITTDEEVLTVNPAELCTNTESGVVDRAQAREDRLRRLEEESILLLRQTRNTLERGNNMSNRLQNLHDQNGSTDASNSTVENSKKT